MAVNPVTGKIYVTNTDAHNDVRFEGHTPGSPRCAATSTESQITVIDPATGAVTPHGLNPHIDRARRGSGREGVERRVSAGRHVSSDGSRSTRRAGLVKLAIYDTADARGGHDHAARGRSGRALGGGPTGLALDGDGERAYVLTRFDNSISTVDLAARHGNRRTSRCSTPSRPASPTGRKYLYDATLTSQHGDTACASCHIGGDKDDLAWDLGNPGAVPLAITRRSATFGHHRSRASLIKSLLPGFAPIFATTCRSRDR